MVDHVTKRYGWSLHKTLIFSEKKPASRKLIKIIIKQYIDKCKIIELKMPIWWNVHALNLRNLCSSLLSLTSSSTLC